MKKLVFVFIASVTCFSGLAQSVNPFTGSFNYNFPLINLPSNRGTGINIDASYNAGIQMNQPASEIGLGWNINAGGAIYRSVSGIPDDAKCYSMPNTTLVSMPIGQGSLYQYNTNAICSTTVYDLSKTRNGMDTTEFITPDFDNYSISAPSLSGQLKLSYYNFYSYTSVSPNNNNSYDYVPTQNNVNYRAPKFHFAGDFADTLVSRHYPDTINASTAFNTPTTSISGLGYTSSFQPFIGKQLNGTTISNQNFDINSGRLATSNFVEYFRNGQIDSGQVANMIDYKTQIARPANLFPYEGIGYFRVTGSNGLTYHYSLPVYQLESTTYNSLLNNDYSLSSNMLLSNYSNANIDYLPNTDPANNLIVKSRETNKYAIKWLLTAITGPDFVDNGDRVAGAGDAGYWISYDYELWNGTYIQRTPKYGFDNRYSPDASTQEYPLYFPNSASAPNLVTKQSGLYGVAVVNKSEVYHLSKIRTTSHTAIFVRDIRKDEKSDDAAVSTTTSFKPAPDLLLKRIILFKNEQLDSISLLPCNSCGFVPTSYPDFNFTNSDVLPSINNFYTENWYTARFVSSNLNYCILKQIVFDQDYSLCKKYHGNVEVKSNSDVLSSPTYVQSNLSVTNLSSSGKLTLNRILTYDFQNLKIIPSTIFDYDKNNLLSAHSNPDYNPLKSDYWGYYKSDATSNAYSRYTNTWSMANTKAWSLLKITDPLGGITQMEYESNMYNKVLDNQSPNGVRGAAFIYRIKNANYFTAGQTSGSYNVVMEEANSTSNSLNEFYILNNSPSTTNRICLPFFENKSCTSSVALNPIFKGFVFGDCDVNINTTNNIVTGNITAIPALGFVGASNSQGSPPSSRNYHQWAGIGGYSYQSADQYSLPQGYTYSGNGYILMQTPIGYDVYGGGIRVKRLKVNNSNNESYVTEYTYENGVATNEMDRFSFPRLKTFAKNYVVRYGFLEPKEFDRFEMSPYIGYSKVTIKNLGRINSSNGKVETTYITDPNQVSYSLGKNFSKKSYASPINILINNFASINTINECINVFANVFGASLETKVFDKNNNILTKSVNEYTTTQQGALTENYFFADTKYSNGIPGLLNYYPNDVYSYTVNIIREIPVVLKSSTTYGMGSYEKSQTVGRDELTGETTSMKSEGKNNSSSSSYKFPAYKHYHVIEGLDFTSAQSRKVLPYGNDMFTYGNIDSSITGNSFLTAAYKLYSKTIKQRQYVAGAFVTNQITLPYYFNNRSFIFDAGQGSMNEFGLLNKTNLYLNPLNLTTINNSLYWEPTSTYNWKLISEATLMDNYKNLIETRDANNRFSASRFGYNGYYKTASVSNCNYASFTFANFENYAPEIPNVSIKTNGTIDGDLFCTNISLVDYNTLLPHTGSNCIQINSTPITFISSTQQSPGNTMEIGLQTGRMYRASVWANSTNLSNAVMEITINGIVNVAIPYGINNIITATSSGNLVTTIGNWNLLQVDFEIPDKFTSTAHGNIFKIDLKSANGTNVYFDDLVFHPVESEFSGSVYNPRNGRLMSNIDGNGLATNYFYDASGRVLEVWKEIPSVGYKRMKRHTYNYARGANN